MRSKTVLQPGMHRGFKRGYRSVAMGDIQQLRRELKKVIGGKTDCKMQYYINGTTIVRQDIAKKIERIFAKRGMKPEEIWDI